MNHELLGDAKNLTWKAYPGVKLRGLRDSETGKNFDECPYDDLDPARKEAWEQGWKWGQIEMEERENM